MVQRGGDGSEDAERGPDHHEAADHTERQAGLGEGLELRRHELELPGKVPEHEPEHGLALLVTCRDLREDG